MTPEELLEQQTRANEAAASVLPLLPRLAGAEWEALVETFRPTDPDYPAVFTDPAPFRSLYKTVWAQIPRRSGVAPEQTEVRVVAATTALLQEPNPIGDAFPGGYRRIAPLLVPDRVWIAWKYVRPGHAAGTAFDGLVRVGDRWVWFPHPWRAVRSPAAGV